MFGLYKQAMVSIRSGLELGLLSVYWNLNDDGHETVRAWLRSQEDTPRLNTIWKKLSRHPNFQAFATTYDLKTRLLDLGYLHNYVHTKGHRFSNEIGLQKSNFQTFEEKGFNIWLDSFEEVIIVLAICHLVKYPLGVIRLDYGHKFGIDKPMFGGLDEFQVDRLEELIGKDIFDKIVAVAMSDPHVVSIIEWVNSLPNMTEEDVERQIIEFEKRQIEMGGLQNWLDSQRQLMTEERDRPKLEARIEMLTAWAKEEGLDRPKPEQTRSFK